MGGNGAAQLSGRYWLTAKALRALGREVPADVPDDQVVIPVEGVR